MRDTDPTITDPKNASFDFKRFMRLGFKIKSNWDCICEGNTSFNNSNTGGISLGKNLNFGFGDKTDNIDNLDVEEINYSDDITETSGEIYAALKGTII